LEIPPFEVDLSTFTFLDGGERNFIQIVEIGILENWKNGIITLVQNRFFTTESQRAQRDNFYLAGRYRQIKSLLSLQNRDPTLFQSPVRRLQFYSRREGIYDPIAASRLDHKKSSSVYSVPPW